MTSERQKQEQGTNEAFKRAVKGGGEPSERTKQEAKSGKAFAAAMKSGKARRANPDAPRATGCNASARQQHEAATGAAFKNAVASSPTAKDKASKAAGLPTRAEWNRLIANATPEERRAAARKLAALDNPKPAACRMVTKPSARTAMLSK